MRRFLAVLLGLTGLVPLGLALYPKLGLGHTVDSFTFALAWRADVRRLIQAEPGGLWNQVARVKVLSGSPTAMKLLEGVNAPLALNPNGYIKLEVILVTWQAGTQTGILIQYDFEDIKSGRTLREVSRTLRLAENHRWWYPQP